MTTMANPTRFTLPAHPVDGVQTGALSRAVLTGQDIREILPAIHSILQKMVPHDYAAIALRDENSGHLELRELSSQYGSVPLQVAMLSTQGTPAGWALTHQTPLLVSRLSLKRFSKPFEGLPAGMLFGCWIPLSRRGETIGVLFV